MPEVPDTAGLVKLFIRLDPDNWHGSSSESLWAEPVSGSDVGNLYRLHNSPFFARGASYLDVVRAEPSDYFDGGLEAVEVMEQSGHSTYMVICQTDPERFKQRWELLSALGCTYENGGAMSAGHLYSVDAPPQTDLRQVDEVLAEGVREGIWICQDGAVRRSKTDKALG